MTVLKQLLSGLGLAQTRSELQQQAATGTSSTDSSPTQLPTRSPAELLAENLEADGGIVNLGRMVGLRSIHRTLKTEDAAVEADIRANHRLLHDGKDMPAQPQGGADDMEIMAARDVHIHQPPTPSPPTAPRPTNPLAVAALTAAGLLGAGALGVAVGNYLNRPQQTADRGDQVFGVDVRDGLP